MECVQKRSVMLIMVLFVHGGIWAKAQVHHVVGDGRGWDTASDITYWADHRTFTVGDFLWFAYSSGIDKDNVIELKSQEEFDSCDVTNPIAMLTEGINRISLPVEGRRYFVSSNTESCKKGLKLPVEVKSKSAAAQYESFHSSAKNVAFVAQEPSAPSSSTQIYCSIMMIVLTIVFFCSVL